MILKKNFLMNKTSVDFPLDQFEKLVIKIGWESFEEWSRFWNERQEVFQIAKTFYGNKFKEDWLWGVVLPLLSDAYFLKNFSKEKKIIGLSALPGTGKTTLGLLIKKLCLNLKIKIAIVSLDDFYLPSNEMQKAISDNPWGVSRGFPGSHSVNLMKKKILEWKNTGKLHVPIFDKSLRSGLGDRVSWKIEYPEILIIEGWFLGINPILEKTLIEKDSYCNLLPEEISYRYKIQKSLENYLDIWSLIDNIWHLKPKEFKFMDDWKINQERKMLQIKGSALEGENLSNFLRMLNTSIPQNSFELIKSSFLLILDKNRHVIWAGPNS
tara:strand:- start:1933 stop:2904 length:972 start_codon:yes stop_codon:yes gene_type:complete